MDEIHSTKELEFQYLWKWPNAFFGNRIGKNSANCEPKIDVLSAQHARPNHKSPYFLEKACLAKSLNSLFFGQSLFGENAKFPIFKQKKRVPILSKPVYLTYFYLTCSYNVYINLITIGLNIFSKYLRKGWHKIFASSNPDLNGRRLINAIRRCLVLTVNPVLTVD